MSVSHIKDVRNLPAEFVDAFAGLVAGQISLDFVRRSMTNLIDRDVSFADEAQSLILAALEEGSLCDEDYDVLHRELERLLCEDIPTDWSDAFPKNAAINPVHPPGHTNGPLYPGAVLRDRYVLYARVESGSMGEIFKAFDRHKHAAGEENCWVAVKVIHPALQRYPDAMRLLEQEASCGQKLTHPSIVRVFGFERDNQYNFITMEWLEGESLATLLTRRRYRPLALSQAKSIFEAIGAALSYAHSQRIVHADVKPGNIFLPDKGGAKLLDFGIACFDQPTDVSDQDPHVRGHTPAYASCEILEGERPQPQDDIFSLASVAYRMFAGRRAFGHLTALAAETARRRPTVVRHLSARQWQALAQALAFRRRDRTREMATLLEAFADVDEAAVSQRTSSIAKQPSAPRLVLMQPLAFLTTGLVAGGLASALILNLEWHKRDSNTQAIAKSDAELRETLAHSSSPPVNVITRTPAVAVNSSPTGPPVSASRTATSTRPPAEHDTDPAHKTPSAKKLPSAMENSQLSMPPDRVIAAAKVNPAVSTSDTPTVADAAHENTQIAAGEHRPMEGSATETVASGQTAAADRDFVPLSGLRFTHFVMPAAPRTLHNQSAQGWVEVRFAVDSSGRTRDVAVADADPKGMFDESALAAVRSWKFQSPHGDSGGRQIHSIVRLRFVTQK